MAPRHLRFPAHRLMTVREFRFWKAVKTALRFLLRCAVLFVMFCALIVIAILAMSSLTILLPFFILIMAALVTAEIYWNK